MTETPTPAQDGFVTRGYRPGDEVAILDLFHRVFHPDRTLAQWRWKYLENPWRSDPAVSLTFAEDGRLAAHYAGYPVPFEDTRGGGPPRPLLAFQIGDTMTAPGTRHVGRGPTSLLGRTVRHFYDTFCRDRIDFNYGFNASGIQRFSLRFVQARRVEPIVAWDLWRDSLRAPRLPRGARVERLEWGSEGDAHDLPWDDLYRGARADYGVLVRRDAAYVRWRHRSEPGSTSRVWTLRRKGDLLAWAALRRDGDRWLWGDGLARRRDADGLLALVAHVLTREEPAAVRVSSWSTARPAWWGDALRRHGFVPRAQRDDLALMCVPFRRAAAAEDLLAWSFYQRADSDLY